MKTIYLRFLWFVLLSVFRSDGIAQYNWTPTVISDKVTDKVILELDLDKYADLGKVYLERNNEKFDLYDDGANGDIKAGDKIYTKEFDPITIIDDLNPDDIFRPFIGTCFVFKSDGQFIKIEYVFAEVLTEEFPVYPICKISNDIKASNYLLNISYPSGTYIDLEYIFEILINSGIELDFDFLNIINIPGISNALPRPNVLQNNINGLGIPIFNNTIGTNITPSLKSYIQTYDRKVFDGASAEMVHPIGHQWMINLGKPFQGSWHWFPSELGNSIMGTGYENSIDFGRCKARLHRNDKMVHNPETGLFHFEELENTEDPLTFNNLELYLMGLMPKDSVSSFVLFDNGDSLINELSIYEFYNFEGKATEYSISDILDIVGERNPEYASSQRLYKIYNLVLSPELLDDNAIRFYSYFAERYEAREVKNARTYDGKKYQAAPFYLATKGLAELSSNIIGFDFKKTIYDTICNGDSIYFEDQILTESGVFSTVVNTSEDCTQLVELNLTVLSKVVTTLNAEVCSGNLYEFNGDLLDSSGQYYNNLISSQGCDSLTELNLEVLPEIQTILEEKICEGNNYDFNGLTINTPGSYSVFLQTPEGCDSIVTLMLDYSDSQITKFKSSICYGDSVLFFNKYYQEEGIYQEILMNVEGCDSIVLLELDVIPFPEAGKIYFLNGETDTFVCINSLLESYLVIATNSIESNYMFLEIDSLDKIIQINYDGEISLKEIPYGVSKIYGISWTGEIEVDTGTYLNNISSTKCLDYSDNYLTINRISSDEYCTSSIFEQDNKLELIVFPNPVYDHLRILLNDSSQSFEGSLLLYNELGAILNQYKFDNKSILELDISNFPSGMYFLKFMGDKSGFNKFVKI